MTFKWKIRNRFTGLETGGGGWLVGRYTSLIGQKGRGCMGLGHGTVV